MESCTICGCFCHNSSCKIVSCAAGDVVCVGCGMKIKHPTASYITGKFRLKNLPVVTAIQYQSNSDPSKFKIFERETTYTGRRFGKYDECISKDGPFLFVATNTAVNIKIVNCGDWIVTDENNKIYTYTNKEFKKLYMEVLTK